MHLSYHELIQRQPLKGPKKDLEAVDDYIKQFSEIDPASTSFRYPVDMAGKPSIPDVTHINLRNLYDVMQKLSALLEGSSCGISHYLDLKMEEKRIYDEIESEYRGYEEY
jgi:hypothetical protein